MSETLSIQTVYHPVRLPQGHDYGIARINGREVPVTDEYLNSDEARSYLELQGRQALKGFLAFIGIVDNLERIAESKTYLCIADDQGKPLYSTWESFLNECIGLKRYDWSRMRSARDGYRWLQSTYKDDDTGLMEQIPENENFFYQLAQIPENQRETALKTVVDGLNGKVLTAQSLERWRKSTKALPAHKASAVDTKPQAVDALETVQVDEEPLLSDMPATTGYSETESLHETAQTPDACVRPDELEEVADVKTASTNETYASERNSDALQSDNADEGINTFEGYTECLIEILKSEEYQKLVAENAIEHSDRGDLKDGEKTVRELIDDAIEVFVNGVNAAQLKIREQQNKDKQRQ